MIERFGQDSNIVKVMAAQARHESIDSNIVEETSKAIDEMVSDLSPQNKYAVAQLVGFAVNELEKTDSNWLGLVADVKNVGFGERAQFKTRLEGIRAVIQAKGATTPRSKVANKTITLDTVSISARPVVNIVELQNGQVNMADLINDAHYQMNLKEMQFILETLDAVAVTWASPYYAAGSTGVTKAVLDPMVRHWMRLSAGNVPAILGDIEMTSKLAELTGFAASNTESQFAGDIINEYNNAGFIGKYIGANVINLLNPAIDGTDDFVLPTKKLYILPAAISTDMRPLKVVHEGGIVSQEQSNIDDKSYEVRLDQYIGAGVVYGDRPYMSIFEDTSV